MAIRFKRIGDLRIDNDLLQRDISEMLGVNRNTYPHWENGLYEIPLEVVDKLADYYGVSVDYLTGLSNYKGTSSRMFDKKVLSSRLYGVRKRHKLSQEKLSVILEDMSQMKLSRYENGITPIPFSRLYLFARKFNISIDYLMGKTDDMNIKDVSKKV